MIQCHWRRHITQLETNQGNHPEMNRMNAVLVSHWSNRCRDQNHRTKRIHNHPDKNHQADNQGNDQNGTADIGWKRSEEHTSELQSRENLVCRLLLEKKKQT